MAEAYAGRVWAEICRRHRLLHLILFGSRVEGYADRLSDWDFAVRFERKPSLRELAALAGDLASVVGDERVDIVVVDHRPLPPPLLHAIFWRGKPLCVRSREAYLWDKVRALALYQEYLQVFRPALEAMVERLAKRGAAKKSQEV